MHRNKDVILMSVFIILHTIGGHYIVELLVRARWIVVLLPLRAIMIRRPRRQD